MRQNVVEFIVDTSCVCDPENEKSIALGCKYYEVKQRQVQKMINNSGKAVSGEHTSHKHLYGMVYDYLEVDVQMNAK